MQHFSHVNVTDEKAFLAFGFAIRHEKFLRSKIIFIFLLISLLFIALEYVNGTNCVHILMPSFCFTGVHRQVLLHWSRE